MSSLEAARRHIRRIERDERPPGLRWLGAIGLVVVLLTAIIGGAEAQLLPGFSADDANGITYQIAGQMAGQMAGLPMTSPNR